MGVESLSDLVTSHQFSKENFTKVTKSLEESGFVSTKRKRSSYSEKQAKNRAGYLAKKLNNPSRLMFYLKCAWNLTDEYLDRLLGIALTKKEPAKYFSASASREMKNNG